MPYDFWCLAIVYAPASPAVLPIYVYIKRKENHSIVLSRQLQNKSVPSSVTLYEAEIINQILEMIPSRAVWHCEPFVREEKFFLLCFVSSVLIILKFFQ